MPILFNSPVSALFAALGSAIGILVAVAFGGNGGAIYHGLFGFNSVLCSIAVGGLFYVLTWRSALYATLCALFGAVLLASLTTFLEPIGMPALTAPFVLSTWLFPWPKGLFKVLQPVPLTAVTTPELIRAAYLAKQRPPVRGPVVLPQ